MRRFSDKRKTTPRVRDGKVHRKNRHQPTPCYLNTPQHVPVLDRQRPGKNHRHLIRKQHLIEFISILPDWDGLSTGLDAIVLAPEREDADGWHLPGIVGVCAWPRTLWVRWTPWYYEEHRGLLQRLGVPSKKDGGEYLCKFTEGTARAYQFLHILVHELGHHHDRMTTKSKADSARGEGFAERYALRYGDLIWERYLQAIGLD